MLKFIDFSKENYKQWCRSSSHYIPHTVEPVFKDHSTEYKQVVSQDRWCLVTVLIC